MSQTHQLRLLFMSSWTTVVRLEMPAMSMSHILDHDMDISQRV